MLIFKEALRFIEEDPELEQDKKSRLITLIQSSPVHPGYSIQWVRACRIFISPQFKEKPLQEKKETIRLLVRGLKKGERRAAFLEILKVFLRISSRSRRGIDLQPFVEIVLEKIRVEPNNLVKGLLVEILLNCPPDSPKLQDYLPGLHHPEESVCFQFIEFINQRFGITGMIALLQEVSRLERPPSLFLWVKLLPIINQHPEIFGYPEMAIINPTTLWPLFKLKQQGPDLEIAWDIPPSAKWLKLRLHLISEESQEKEREEAQVRMMPVEKPNNLFPGNRWQLIQQDIERMKIDVPFNHHKNRDPRPRRFA